MKSVLVLSLFVCILTRRYCQSLPSIEFLISTADRPGNGVFYDGPSYASAPAIVRSCSKLCVNGLWAMYTLPSFGAANPSAVVVYPVKGSSPSQCTESSVNHILSKIQSFKQIANPTGTEFFDKHYFVGLGVPVLPPVVTTIKSFGLQDPGNSYQICNDNPSLPSTRCVCALANRGPFLVPSIDSWPTDNPLRNIGSITPIPAGTETPTNCLGDRPFG